MTEQTDHIGDTNKMVTAVEWLYERLERMIPRRELYRQDKIQYLEQAKQMEKARIIDAFNKGEIQGLKSTNNSFHSSLITAEEYYNETYLNK